MPAAATCSPQVAAKAAPLVAARPHYLSTLTRSAIATLLASCCHLSSAADLPTAYADSVPGADNALSQKPVLQTNNKVLPVDVAFALTTFIEADSGKNGQSIVLRWEMPPAHYLYQKSLVVTHADGTPINLELPEAIKITDEFFGEVAVYYTNVLVRLPFAALNAKPGTTVDFLLTYQGCAEALYCYPPEQKALKLNIP
jgi:thiol:disulfide interchange protein DsbD